MPLAPNAQLKPPKNDGTWEEKWLECVCCGRMWPQSQTCKNKGKTYCISCYDPPQIDRPIIRHERNR